MNRKQITETWNSRLRPACGYTIALGLLVAGPLLAGAGLGMAWLTGEPLVLGFALLGGAGLGAAGAGALLWCLGDRTWETPPPGREGGGA